MIIELKQVFFLLNFVGLCLCVLFHFTLPVFGSFSPDYLLLVQLSVYIFLFVQTQWFSVLTGSYWFLNFVLPPLTLNLL